VEVQDTFNVKVKFVEIKGMTGGKSVEPCIIDPEVLKRGDQMGFVTPVVHALTYGNWDGQWFRAYGNENWEFDEQGLMKKRFASINDMTIMEAERRL